MNHSKHNIIWCINWCKKHNKDQTTDYEWTLAHRAYNKKFKG